MSDEPTETAAPVPPEVTNPPALPPTPDRGRTTGGQTYVDRYVTPFVIPVVAVVAIVFYVLNLSRAFLSGKDTIAVVAAAIVTAGILFGAAALSAAPRMRSQSLALTLGIALLGVLFTGWITVGHAQEEKTAAAVACPKPVATVNVTVPSGQLKFEISTANVKAGCVAFNVRGSGGHTFTFRPSGPADPVLHSDPSGPQKFAWDLKPGTYTYYCTVDSHAQAGMTGTLTVK